MFQPQKKKNTKDDEGQDPNKKLKTAAPDEPKTIASLVSPPPPQIVPSLFSSVLIERSHPTASALLRQSAPSANNNRKNEDDPPSDVPYSPLLMSTAVQRPPKPANNNRANEPIDLTDSPMLTVMNSPRPPTSSIDNKTTRLSGPWAAPTIPLEKPSYSDQRQIDSMWKGSAPTLPQPVRTSVPAKSEPGKLPDREQVEQALRTLPKPPTIANTKVTPAKFALHNESARESGASGSNQKGLSTNRKVVRQPAVADYAKRRPEQMLSQISDVVRWNAENAKQAPVEVQFGYGVRKGEQPELFSSTNNLASQQWMAEALRDPALLLKNAALKSTDQHVKRTAMKLLFHDDQHAARRKAVESDKTIDESQRTHLLGELELAKNLRGQFLGGTHTVVENKTDRHAEQNVAAALHIQHSKKPYEKAEIAGTMIRCASCGIELGHNLVDAESHLQMHGKLFSNQVAEKKGTRFLKGPAGSSLETEDSRRSRSVSPVRFSAEKSADKPAAATDERKPQPESKTKEEQEEQEDL